MALSIKAMVAGFKKPAKANSRKPVRAQQGLAARITAFGDRLAFSWKVREALYRHMSAQVENSVTVEAALDGFQGRLLRRKKVSSAKIVGDVARRMRDGSTFAAAMTKWVPQDEVSVISSGEIGGNLPKALNLVIDAKQRIARVNTALKTSLVSPLVYVFAVYGMIWAIGHYVTPSLQQVLPKEKAQGLVAGLYAAGDFANSWWAVVPPLAIILIFAAIVYSLPNWTGRKRVVAERMFPYSFYRDMQGYTWLMSFSALLRSGMADVEILQRQRGNASPWLKERVHALWWRMDNGASLSAAMLAKGKGGMPAFGFPNPDIVDDISSMAGFGDFPVRISAVATHWAEELERSTLAFAKSFGFAMEIFMYMVMGVLMLAINAMSTQVGNVPGM